MNEYFIMTVIFELVLCESQYLSFCLHCRGPLTFQGPRGCDLKATLLSYVTFYVDDGAGEMRQELLGGLCSPTDFLLPVAVWLHLIPLLRLLIVLALSTVTLAVCVCVCVCTDLTYLSWYK